MNASYPYASQPATKPKRPRFLSLFLSFVISSIIGLVLGQISSFFYSLIGSGGGLTCLTFPICLIIFGGTGALSFFLTKIINKKLSG
jgi:hypothetical protein